MTAPIFEVTGRLLYRVKGQNPHHRDEKGRVDLAQIDNMERSVKAHRADARIAPADARRELAILGEIRAYLVAGDARKAMVTFASAEREMQVRPKGKSDLRKARQAERVARKQGRKPKKKKRR